MKKSDFIIPVPQRFILLLCMFLLCYILTAAISYLLGRVISDNMPAALRISAVVQDVLAFIVPAVGTAVIATRRPAELLCLTRRPSLLILLFVVVCSAVSVPLQEVVIYWNYNIQLPENLAAFEEVMRGLEDAANTSLMQLIGDTSWASLILNILIIGIAAAVAEELIFRGCFLRLMTTAGINKHIAIWVVAIVFSAMHMQFYGFIPRMLLGVYFGYLLLWTGSIIVPIVAHMLNNVLYVVMAWFQCRSGNIEALTAEPTLWSWQTTIASLILTATALVIIHRFSKKGIPFEK